MQAADFWDNRESSVATLNELNDLKAVIKKITEAKKTIQNNFELTDILKQDNDESVLAMLESDVANCQEMLTDLENVLLLSGPYDKCSCILEIHPGAGGTESCDWAMMLYRMYCRYCENHDYKIELLDYQDGEEAGIKSVSLIINGINAYGYLKWEKGVHRLIRISPFDSNSRRHTSFASVDITPVFEDDDKNIEIAEDDIRIDVYRSSGKGGQGVNTTDSAVRITHIPTGIVVTCQNERSQIRNKETAFKVLTNKLYQLEVERKNKELQSIKGENKEINFGSQIRTYTLHPYSLVKDHRTNVENANVAKVLDGDLDVFINSNLKWGVNYDI